jgi:hypothetical protein
MRNFILRYGRLNPAILTDFALYRCNFDVISFPNTYVIAPGWKLYKKYSGASENKASNILAGKIGANSRQHSALVMRRYDGIRQGVDSACEEIQDLCRALLRMSL